MIEQDVMALVVRGRHCQKGRLSMGTDIMGRVAMVKMYQNFQGVCFPWAQPSMRCIEMSCHVESCQGISFPRRRVVHGVCCQGTR